MVRASIRHIHRGARTPSIASWVGLHVCMRQQLALSRAAKRWSATEAGRPNSLKGLQDSQDSQASAEREQHCEVPDETACKRALEEWKSVCLGKFPGGLYNVFGRCSWPSLVAALADYRLHGLLCRFAL